jgi:CheY-like chemotaxis protein
LRGSSQYPPACAYNDPAVAKVLLIESDSVFAAVLADRLHVAGHEVRRLTGGARAADTADDLHADLVVVGESASAGLEVVEALRGRPATRAVPILMLSDRGTPADRVAALRAGVDDHVSRPCDLEELLLRLDRLLTRRSAAQQVLQGDLANHPLWEVVQYLGQTRKSGGLQVTGPAGNGSIEMRHGAALAARWRGLRGKEALLALLSLAEGGFRFDPHPAGEEPPPAAAAGSLPLQELLLEAAWLKDELAKRRHKIPATGQPLHALTPQLSSPGEQFAGLPLRRIFNRVLQQPGVRLFDLIADEAEAPISTRLAVALLVEQGAVAMQSPDAGTELQNTREISTAIVLDIAVEDLIEAAAQAGFAGPVLRYLLLVEPLVWPALRRLLTEAPGFRQNEGLRRLAGQAELRQAGSATFASRRGELSLQVEALDRAAPPQVEAVIPSCAGILVWVRSAESRDAVRAVVERLESGGSAGAGGVLVAAGDSRDLIGSSRRWRSTPHEPQSLLGVLRLLHPPAAGWRR